MRRSGNGCARSHPGWASPGEPGPLRGQGAELSHVLFRAQPALHETLTIAFYKAAPYVKTQPLILWIAATAALCGAARAQQPGSIRGVVSDKEFGGPVPEATVSILGRRETAKASDQGNYLLRELPPGTYTLIFAKDGYVRQVRPNVEVRPGQLVEVDVALAGDFTDLEEYVVQDILAVGGGTEDAQLQLRFESPSLMDSISADLMNRAGASDAASALRLVSGASLQNGKSAVIRGLPDRYVSSKINGVRLPSADEDKRAVELDQFPSAVIESVQVTKTFTPDQQGDASGGAVDVRLRGIPEEELVMSWSMQASHNPQATGTSNFLGYEGGGVHFFGRDGGDRDQQLDLLGQNWDGAVGVQRQQAPVAFKWQGSFGGYKEIADGVKLGGFVSLFYEQDVDHYKNGRDDSWWVDVPGDPMTPQISGNGGVLGGDFQTSLFDVTQSTQSVQLGALTTLGLETKNHSLTLLWLNSRTAEDTVTLAEDTRGKEFFFPGYDPNNTNTPGHSQPDAAPYLRTETLQYTERTTDTLQLSGRHTLPLEPGGPLLAPKLDWTMSQSSADKVQPDKRIFGSKWDSTNGGTYSPYKPAANFTIGNFQRIWKSIDEESSQYTLNLELPFEQWDGIEGSLKVGWFNDNVKRSYDQDTFSNFNDNSTINAPWEQYWSATFPFEDHPITAAEVDVDYEGKQQIEAYYAMLDLPLFSGFSAIGGVRFENTKIDIVNDAESDVLYFPPSAPNGDQLDPGEADVFFRQSDALPAMALVYEPVDGLTLRAAYSETIARQTFKELTPILQQEYLGGPIFIGNPELVMSALKNYDLRLDWTPYEGGLISASWFKKDVKDAIEYVQRVNASFDFTTALNYPTGEINGYELEARTKLDQLWEPLSGVGLGANATWIDSTVTLSDSEVFDFSQPGVEVPITERDMTNAPESLFNAFATWESDATGTRLGLFYTFTGDTRVAGAGVSNQNFIPNVYQDAYDQLNFTLSQRLSEGVDFRFQAKNLTNPAIQQHYRSEYIGEDVLRSSFTRGIDYSISFGGRIVF